MKLFDIEQQLPSLASYYVIRQDGDYKIFLVKIGSSLQKQIQNMDKSEEKIEVIVKELQSLKKKRESGPLAKNDSLRIEYLFNQYQNLKNGH